jgi:hypothetical protein
MREDGTDDLRGRVAQTSVCAVLIWVSRKQKTQTKGAQTEVCATQTRVVAKRDKMAQTVARRLRFIARS